MNDGYNQIFSQIDLSFEGVKSTASDILRMKMYD